jgi:hypothetical protein
MKQDSHAPSKANSTTKYPNICVEKELSNNESQRTAKMINTSKKKHKISILPQREHE